MPTLLGLARRGYFIPYRYAHATGDRQTGAGPAYPALATRIGAAEQQFTALLQQMQRYTRELLDIGDEPPPAPRWTQDWFPRLDAAAAYTLIRVRRPGRLIEIGSGHSTRWFMRAAADGDLPLHLTAIDPAPRAAVAGLGIELMRTTVQRVDPAMFAALRGGDVFSLDGSHVLMPGTDVDVVLNRILPVLPAGVLVHIHDIFLPDDYPADWTWRGYNEQLAMAPLLQGDNWKILWSSRWVATRMPERLAGSVAARLPLLPGAYETSLWLEKTSPASIG